MPTENERVQDAPAEIHLLNDTGCEIEGKTFWGSPYTRGLYDSPLWAFGAPDEVALKSHWAMIPENVDVLVTHSPPRNILDKCYSPGEDVHGLEDRAGSISLTAEIFDRIHCSLSCFGHIHESHGMEIRGGITFVNASIMDRDYNPVNKPTIIEI